jgi:asparagine synthase (glutamine-hydrolysing)
MSMPDGARLRRTAWELKHRGPDGEGTFLDRGVGLVHTRLSLVDLNERSNQPLWDRSGRYCLVYNGELYDYEELKWRLNRRGVVFRTTSDSEVLLEGLVNFGIEPTVDELDGMFAFGFYDRVERILVLARDRLGIKPLHVHEGGNAFLFASTPRAFKPWLTLRPNMDSISSYLLGFPGPTLGASFFDEIEMLPPGTVLRIRARETSQRTRFFSTNGFSEPSEANPLATEKPADLIDRAEELLLASVKSQMNADAPVGVLSSGGVDSSLVAAMAAKCRCDFVMFHADVQGPLSERSPAAALARWLKLEFQAIPVGDTDFIERLPDVIEHYERPFTFHPESIALLKLAESVRDKGVKAVLCGEGSDECYFGYPWLARTSRARLRPPDRPTRFLPGWLGRSGPPAGQTLPVFATGNGQVHQGIDHQLKLELGPIAFDAWHHPDTRSSAVRRNCILRGLLAYVLRTLLHRNDRLGMAAGVEARFPFLSNRLMHFAENLSPAYKMRFSPLALRSPHPFFCDKWIIRQVAKRYLPRQFSRRPKQPFLTNAYDRLHVSHAFFQNSFLSDLLQLEGARLAQVIESTDRALRLRLLQLDVWGQVCLQDIPKCHVVQRLRNHTRLSPR